MRGCVSRVAFRARTGGALRAQEVGLTMAISEKGMPIVIMSAPRTSNRHSSPCVQPCVSEMETEIPALVEVMVREILMGLKRLPVTMLHPPTSQPGAGARPGAHR